MSLFYCGDGGKKPFFDDTDEFIKPDVEEVAEVFFLGQRIGKEKVEREDGYLYYIGKDGYVWRAPMKNNPRGSKKRVGTEKIEKKGGFMYYLDKAGYVAQAKLKNA